MEVYFLALLFVLAIGVIGILYFTRSRHNRVVGTIVVDKTDPEGPYLFLDLEPDGLDYILSHETVELKIKTRDSRE